MTGPSRRLSRSGAVLAATFILVSGSGMTQAANGTLPTASGELVLSFDGALSPRPGQAGWLDNSGTGAVTTSVKTASGGSVTLATGRPGTAAKFPAFAPTPTPAAALVVRPAAGGDALSPGKLPIRWGADVYLSKASQKSATDNGANVVQRGLYGDPAQVKLQLDADQPSCRVQGTAGSATVVSTVKLRPTVWYRIHCQLRAGELTLQVEDLSASATPTVARDKAAVGPISFSSSVPVTVGAKCDAAGQILTSGTDQFNGTLDNVFWDVGS